MARGVDDVDSVSVLFGKGRVVLILGMAPIACGCSGRDRDSTRLLLSLIHIFAIGFEEKGADNRIAQYETNYRVPKRELLDKMAEALRVDRQNFYTCLLYTSRCV